MPSQVFLRPIGFITSFLFRCFLPVWCLIRSFGAGTCDGETRLVARQLLLPSNLGRRYGDGCMAGPGLTFATFAIDFEAFELSWKGWIGRDLGNLVSALSTARAVPGSPFLPQI